MKVLLLSPHTDDVELGCGGTVIKLLQEGHEVFWVVFSTAEDSLPAGLDKDTLRNEFAAVAEDLKIGKDHLQVHSYKVRNLHQHRQEILEDMIRTRNQYRPDLVFGPSPNDLHQDHQVVSSEMLRAFKNTSSILCYELPWNHVSFNTQCFSKLSKENMEGKCRILENYRSQTMAGRQYFSKEFIYGLARTRGVQCNSEYAEAFEVVRWML